jgi:hypothetical protein
MSTILGSKLLFDFGMFAGGVAKNKDRRRLVAEHNGIPPRGNRARQDMQAKRGKMTMCVFKVGNV